MKALAKYMYPIFTLLTISSCFSQDSKSPILGRTVNPKFEKRINKLLNFSIPILTVDSFAASKASYLVLDAREMEEYEVSHIPGASFIGYKKPLLEVLDTVDKDQKILLYCSVGYRSEKLGKKIQKLGFKKVYNLYGSIFEWANKDYPLEDNAGKRTNKVHTYNSKWSKWVIDGKVEKVW